MKIDARDQTIFDDVALRLRCSLAERFDALSALTMSDGSAEVMDQIDEQIRALNGPVAELQAWTDAKDVCAEVIDSASEPTLKLVVDEMKEIYDELVEDGPSLARAIPELFPHLIISYGKLNRYLVALEAAGNHTEQVCEMIGPDALDNLKAGDPATISHAAQISARMGVADAIADGRLNSIEAIRDARSLISAYGADPDAAWLPKVWPDDFNITEAETLLAKLSTITGCKLNAEHLEQTATGTRRIRIDPATRESAPPVAEGTKADLLLDDAEPTRDTAGLDGGSDNIPTVFDRPEPISAYGRAPAKSNAESRSLNGGNMHFMATRDLGHRSSVDTTFERRV